MAPRRGGGGSSGSGGGGVRCSDPFGYSYYPTYNSLYRTSAIANFACYCLFFLVTLAITIALCCIRKRHGNSKRLIGPIFLLSLLFNLM